MIVSHPRDRTVFLDDDARFNCITQRNFTPYWRLNGTDYDDLPSQLHDDLALYRFSEMYEHLALIIVAKAEYNGTRVQCVTESNDGDSVVSNTATLSIQGMCIGLHTHIYHWT